MDKLTIFSDGACSGNPGPGGWAARLLYDDGRINELGGHAADTTTNRRELQAAIDPMETFAINAFKPNGNPVEGRAQETKNFQNQRLVRN